MLTRRAALSASLEDYIKAAHRICADKGSAHVTDMAKELGVSKPSVTGALRLLATKGLINHRPYGSVTLTDAGLSAAQEIVNRHRVMKEFFVKVLSVDEYEAEGAAREAGNIRPEVFRRLTRFLEYYQTCPSRKVAWFEQEGFRCAQLWADSCEECKLLHSNNGGLTFTDNLKEDE